MARTFHAVVNGSLVKKNDGSRANEQWMMNWLDQIRKVKEQNGLCAAH